MKFLLRCKVMNEVLVEMQGYIYDVDVKRNRCHAHLFLFSHTHLFFSHTHLFKKDQRVNVVDGYLNLLKN